MKLDANLIKMFGASVIAEAGKEMDFSKVNEEAMKRGYLIDPKCCDANTYNFVMSINTDYNSTFYKNWGELVSKNRIEIYFDQMLHYITAYYTDHAWVPNDGSNKEDIPDFSSFKIIKAITAEDMYEKCFSMITSGIALAHSTMVSICEYIIEYSKTYNSPVVIDEVVNKEAQVYLCNALNIYPNDKFALLRYLVYRATLDTMIIKSPEAIRTIRENANTVDLSKLSEKQLVDLSSIFYRFKPIFLAFRNGSKSNKEIINRLRRMAVKNHKPFHAGSVETLLSTCQNIDKVKRIVDSMNNFKIVSIMQTINDRLLMAAGQGKNLYVIRNGKSFVKDNTYNVIDSRYAYWEDVYKVLENQLIENLSARATAVKFSKDLNLMCPNSEKNFIGNIPMGSYYNLSNHNIIGIYWRNEWGACDLDLSYVDYFGRRIGWNSDWYNREQTVMYSGDIVNAPNGANELLYCKGNYPNGIVYINRFDGRVNNKFDLFIAKSKNDKINREYMVDPNDVLMRESITQGENRQYTPGFINDNKFYFLPMANGKDRISSVNNDLVDITLRKTKTFIDLKSILLKAGFVDLNTLEKEIVTKTSEDTGVTETVNTYTHWYEGGSTTYYDEDIIDLTDLNKDTLIELFK